MNPDSPMDQTERYEAKMDEILREIERRLSTLKTLSDPPSTEKVNRDALSTRMKDILTVELPEMIEKMSS